MPTTPAGSAAAEDRFELANVSRRVLSNWRLVVLVIVVAMILGVGYTVVTPAAYEAKATLFFPSRASSILGPVGISDASGGGASSLLSGSAPSPLKIFRAFLDSDRSLQAVSAGSGLKKKKVEEAKKLSDDGGSNTLSIAITLPSKEKAKEVLDLYLQSLRKINSDLSVQSLLGDTEAIHEELATQKERLRAAERELESFQSRQVAFASSVPNGDSSEIPSGTDWGQMLIQTRIELDGIDAEYNAAIKKYQRALGQSNAMPADLPPVVALRPELVKAEYQLRLLLKTLGPEAPDVLRQKDVIQNLKQELNSEITDYLESAKKGLIDPTRVSSGTNAAPQAGALTDIIERRVGLQAQIVALEQLVRAAPEESRIVRQLAREVSIATEIVKNISLQYQAAKLQALRDPNKWSLLDPPHVEDDPVNKKYALTAGLSAFVGLFLGLFFAANFGKSR